MAANSSIESAQQLKKGREEVEDMKALVEKKHDETVVCFLLSYIFPEKNVIIASLNWRSAWTWWPTRAAKKWQR
jgi:hypothetical protein